MRHTLTDVTTIQSLERGLRILDELVQADADPVRRHGVPLAVLAAELGVHRTTALRLVQTLAAAGYAVPVEGRQGYRLGPAMRRQPELSIGARRLKRVARPFLEELVDATGECAHAAVADGQRALVIDDVETDRPLRAVASTGRHVPLHCTSAGKVLLAYGLADLPQTLTARTSRSITDPEILRLHLAHVREVGYAYDDEENDPHTRCLSAPVFGPDGAAVGCIGIDAPSVRLTPERVVAVSTLIVDVAQRLTAALAPPAARAASA